MGGTANKQRSARSRAGPTNRDQRALALAHEQTNLIVHSILEQRYGTYRVGLPTYRVVALRLLSSLVLALSSDFLRRPACLVETTYFLVKDAVSLVYARLATRHLASRKEEQLQ